MPVIILLVIDVHTQYHRAVGVLLNTMDDRE